MKYELNEIVYYVSNERYESSIICPECLGEKFLTVILGDKSKVTIPCAGCSQGCDPPTGFIYFLENKPKIIKQTITGIEINNNLIIYKSDYTILDNDRIFKTKKEAEKKLNVFAKKLKKENEENRKQKKDNNRTWSWHVHYYRKRIRNAKEEIARFELKLNYVKEMNKK